LNPTIIDYGHFGGAFQKAYNANPGLLPMLFQHGKSRADRPTLDMVVSIYKENVIFLAEELQRLRDLPCFQDIDIRTIGLPTPKTPMPP